jgi:hypothetical protein
VAGAGCLERRGENSWGLIAFVGVNPSTERPRYAKKTFRGTKREATRELTRFVAETNRQRDAGVARGQAEMTVVDMLERWLDVRAACFRPPPWTDTGSRSSR